VADFFLEVNEGREAGRQVELRQTIEIGRDASLPLALDDEQVSRRHARITLEGGRPVVEDLGSTNGTYVNDQPTLERRELRPGDRVRVGLTVLLVRTAQEVARQPSAVRPTPQLTALGQEVLRPAAPGELARPAASAPPASASPEARAPASEEFEPAFVPPEVLDDAEARSDYEAVARLIDVRTKRQTNIAVFALLGAAGLAVLLVFGLK
jgi:pSer/pThr/pTyr-binding forkhead associated (FHA) protein